MKSAGLSSNAGSSAVMFIGPAVRLSPDDFIANSNKTEKNYAVDRCPKFDRDSSER